MPKGIFIHLDAATLATMLIDWQTCLTSIATGLQSYSLAGRSFTRANLSEVSSMVAEISYAISAQGGNLPRRTYTRIS